MAAHPPPLRSASNNAFIIDRNTNFKATEASRPPFNPTEPITTTQTPAPSWRYSDGPNIPRSPSLSHVEIDPYATNRSFISNYKLLISAIPRPISYVSTLSSIGEPNLAPFSYFQVVDHDPPIFVIGFSARKDRVKDTRRNLLETGECVISVVSEHMIEAVNGSSLELPREVSEWGLSGFEAAESSTVKPWRVKDSIFSVEGKLLEMKELDYGKAPGTPCGALAIVKGTRFWVREDALDEKKDSVRLNVMRPLVQLGGISYGRIGSTFELPRPGLQTELEDEAKGLRHFVGESCDGTREEAPEVKIKLAAAVS
jgi:flavin reductase (DIM6/NTAB) family NADH-FMN oxidoreductase RutF